MQQLVKDIKDMEGLLEPFCENIMKWESVDTFHEIQQIVQPMTNMVSLVLNNKQVFESLGIDVREESILSGLEQISQALERQDDILLLDGIYRGYLPWLKEIGEKIRAML